MDQFKRGDRLYLESGLINEAFAEVERELTPESPGSFYISLAFKKKHVLEQGFLAFKLSNNLFMRHRD